MKNVLMILCLSALAFNTWANPPRGGGPSEEERAAMEECASDLGVERPEPGSKPSEKDEENMEAIKSCMSEKGFELKGPPKGPRPDEDRSES